MKVYAKISELTDSEGNVIRLLDWGHIVTSPQGLTPEEMGYTEFSSLEDAKEFFNISDE